MDDGLSVVIREKRKEEGISADNFQALRYLLSEVVQRKSGPPSRQSCDGAGRPKLTTQQNTFVGPAPRTTTSAPLSSRNTANACRLDDTTVLGRSHTERFARWLSRSVG